jgi:hypothetical protein
VPAILVRKAADAVPLGASVLWAVFAGVCACCYLALQTAFERVEAVSMKQREFLVDY